jgi:hypothetical protein
MMGLAGAPRGKTITPGGGNQNAFSPRAATMTPGAAPTAAGGGGLIRGADGRLHTRGEVPLYGGSLNREIAAQSPWAAFSGGAPGSTGGPVVTPGGGNQNAFSPQAARVTQAPATPGTSQADALRAILSQMVRGGGGNRYYGRGNTAGYTTSGR